MVRGTGPKTAVFRRRLRKPATTVPQSLRTKNVLVCSTPPIPSPGSPARAASLSAAGHAASPAPARADCATGSPRRRSRSAKLGRARRSGSGSSSYRTARSTPCAAMCGGSTCSASMRGHRSYERIAADTMCANGYGVLRRAVPAGRTVSEGAGASRDGSMSTANRVGIVPMNTPLQRLFVVFWWGLVATLLAGAVWWGSYERDAYCLDEIRRLLPILQRVPSCAFGPHPTCSYTPEPDPVIPISPYVLHGAAGALAVLLVPFLILTIVRWIITSRWRFGPRW